MRATRSMENKLPAVVPALAVCLLVLFFAACREDEVCEELTANDLRIGFYVAGEEDGEWTVIDSLRVTVPEKPGEPVYDHLELVSVLELPLNPSTGSTTFVIDFYHTKDTLHVFYERETRLISVECGFTMFFHILDTDCTNHYIESLVEVNNHVTNTLDEHLKAFIPGPADTD